MSLEKFNFQFVNERNEEFEYFRLSLMKKKKLHLEKLKLKLSLEIIEWLICLLLNWKLFLERKWGKDELLSADSLVLNFNEYCVWCSHVIKRISLIPRLRLETCIGCYVARSSQWNQSISLEEWLYHSTVDISRDFGRAYNFNPLDPGVALSVLWRKVSSSNTECEKRASDTFSLY